MLSFFTFKLCFGEVYPFALLITQPQFSLGPLPAVRDWELDYHGWASCFPFHFQAMFWRGISFCLIDPPPYHFYPYTEYFQLTLLVLIKNLLPIFC